jgi:hypothetical protein
VATEISSISATQINNVIAFGATVFLPGPCCSELATFSSPLIAEHATGIALVNSLVMMWRRTQSYCHQQPITKAPIGASAYRHMLSVFFELSAMAHQSSRLAR